MKTREKVAVILIIAAILIAVILISSFITYGLKSKLSPNRELDMYKVEEYSLENAEAVMDSLSRGGDGLKDLMSDPSGIGKLLRYTDWADGDYDNKRSFGGGNNSEKVNSKGQIEYSEMYWVPVNGEKYMIYIETVTSRYGRDNDGVSFIAVTSWSHYDAINWEWDWATDDETVRVGTPFGKE